MRFLLTYRFSHGVELIRPPLRMISGCISWRPTVVLGRAKKGYRHRAERTPKMRIMKLLLLIFTGLLTTLVLFWLPRNAGRPQAIVAVSAAPRHATSPANVLSSNEVRLQECSEKLRRGQAWLRTVPAYTATFRKQERLGDQLHDENTIELKLRHQPFSVSMHWLDEGRVVYYRDGHNENRMTVKMGGWKGRLGWINLDPHSRLALSEARYPVTQVGLVALIDELLRQWEPFSDRADGVLCEWLEDERVGGRPCRVFRVNYAGPEVFAEYRQSTVWLDREHSVPLRVLNYDWERHDPANPDGLVEHYVYENVDFDAKLVEADFQLPNGKVTKSHIALQDGGE